MPAFQFESAVFLAGSGLVSVLVLVLSRPKEGKVKLPTATDAASDDEGELELEGEKADPFDVTKPEDVIDGYPIDADGFWEKVRPHLSKRMSPLTLGE